MTQRSVLLVDDDRLLLDLYGLALRRHGFTVHMASDESTARVIALRARPDVAVVDGRLAHKRAGRQGAELAGELAAQGIAVVLFTNDQGLYDNPPPRLAGRLVKVNTRPQELAAHLAALLSDARSGIAS